MQTFLPYSKFEKAAKVLDYRRLGKQRVEAWQIFLALTRENYGWRNHPIVKMWRGYEKALLKYGEIICIEWISRNYNDSMLERFQNEFDHFSGNLVMPPWIEDRYLIRSHRSNLIRKDPTYYKKFWPNVPDNIPYKWII